MNYEKNKIELNQNGFSFIECFYSENEIQAIINSIDSYQFCHKGTYKSKDLFAIRQLIKNIPNLKKLLFNSQLNNLLKTFYKTEFFLTKSIYFDKPPKSNWFVAYHQDLSIAVDRKTELNNYKSWTNKKDQYGVIPPAKILKDTITVRIHLDDTTKNNGALKVIPKSHQNGILRRNSDYWNLENEVICEIKKHGIMLMKPLLLHASNKTINNQRRRVIHLEFNNNELDKPLKWLEHEHINQ